MTYTHILKQWRSFFGSLTKALEILAVWEGLKPCARILVYEDDLQKTIQFLTALPLHSEVAEFKVDLSFDATGGTNSYSSKGHVMDAEEKNGWNILYVSKNVVNSETAKAAEEKQDHILLGKMLGYPSCCTKFFSHYSGQEKLRHNTFIQPLLEHSDTDKNSVFPFANNVFLRTNDICLLSHIPCSLDCPKSEEIGKQMMQLLHKYSVSTEQFFRERLSSTLLVADAHPVIVLENPVPVPETVNVFRFNSALAERMIPVAAELNQNKEVEKMGKKGILVGNRLYPEYWLVRFG